MSVVALAIVSRENIPLLIRTRSDYANDPEAAAERLKLIYLLHSSLDIIEEKQTQTQNRDAYLGLLNQLETYKIYGLLSSTKTKVIIMISTNSTIMLRDNEARNMLKQIHANYIDATTNNPFYSTGEAIDSKALENSVKQIFVGVPT